MPPRSSSIKALDYNFYTWDYVIVSAVLGITAIIGFYYIWKAQRSKNTREFLVANKHLGLAPLIMSAAATGLSSGSLLGVPMEAYSNGAQMAIGSLFWVIGTAIAAFTTVPVLYKLNVNTTNQYIKYRFSRFLSVFPAVISLLQNSILIGTITYVTALVLSQATGLHLTHSIGLIAGLCMVYSSLGGFVAVIWTDVFQMLMIFAAYFIMLVKGTIHSGGFSEIWERNRLGNRTIFFHWTSSPMSNYTVWSIVTGYFSLGFLVTATSQTFLQRQLANKNLAGAQMTTMGTVFITKALSFSSVWIGMCVYATYYDCDPWLAGRITSRDQTAASFAMDMFRDIPGLSGLYVGGILCATLSTLSSVVNAFAAVTLIDFIKPLIPNITDTKAKILSKVIGGLYGLLVFVLSCYADKFGSNIIQMFQAIGGTSLGSNASIYILGFFFPWANAKGVTVGYIVSMAFGWWLSINRVVIGNPYITAPMSIAGCDAFNSTMSMLSNTSGSTFFGTHANELTRLAVASTTPATVAKPVILEEHQFFINNIFPIWFSVITVTIGVVVGLTASLFYSCEDVQNVDPNLISPLTKWLIRRLPKSTCDQLGVLHFKSTEKKFVSPDNEFKDPPQETELHLLNHVTDGVQVTTNGQVKGQPTMNDVDK